MTYGNNLISGFKIETSPIQMPHPFHLVTGIGKLQNKLKLMHLDSPLSLSLEILHFVLGCHFYPRHEYMRFQRVPEDLPVGTQILNIEAHPRETLSIDSILPQVSMF